MKNLMHKLWRENRLGVAIMAVALIPAIMAQIYGPSHWIEIHNLKVSSGPVFDDMAVIYDREIKREFPGEFAVAIWADGELHEGGQGVICKGEGSVPYAPASGAILRDMEWLMGEQRPPCDPLMKPGKSFRAYLCITARPDQWWLRWIVPRTCYTTQPFVKTKP